MPGVLTRTCTGALALALVAGVSACGDSDDESKGGGTASVKNELALSIAETGKTAKFTVPKSAKGGLTTVTLKNTGKQRHGGQLVRIEGDHTPQDVFKAFEGDDKSKNEWLRAEGGVGAVEPGGSGSATLELKPGRYMVVDTDSEDGPPPYAELELTAGEGGSLPSSETTITAAETGEDKYKWEISSPLKSGKSTITFKSEGKEALHFIGVARLTKDVPKKEVLKALGQDGPPKFVDEKSFYSTAILDGEKSEVTDFVISKPGKWVLFCPLVDRGEDEEHFKQGMLEIVDVK